MKKGIDVSEHNGLINWEITKNYIDFAFIRVTYGKKGLDKTAIQNIENCIKFNIPFGVYVYSYALNLNDAVLEANFLIQNIMPYKDKIKLGVAIDMEDADGYKKNHNMPKNEMLCDICKCECNIFEAHGLRPLIYASKWWFDNILTLSSLNKIEKWVAWWNKDAKVDFKKYKIWQYTSNGSIEGIKGRVDLNMYEDLEKTNKELLKNDVLKYPEYAHATLNKLIENGTLKGSGGEIDLSIDSIRLLVILDRNKLFDK